MNELASEPSVLSTATVHAPTRTRASVPPPRPTSGAVGRAYARRAGRLQRMGAVEDAEGRSRFVLMIMVMLGVGLVTSLWLSTTASADSYRLNAARQATRDLSERIETVQSQIDALQSPPAIARAATSMGMVQVSDTARLIVGPDGHVSVFGTPKVAAAAPPPVVVAPVAVVPGAPAPAATDRMTPEQLVALQAQPDPRAAASGAPAQPAPDAPVQPAPAGQAPVQQTPAAAVAARPASTQLPAGVTR